jgi:hypothetical protein
MLPARRHSFTHFELDMQPLLARLSTPARRWSRTARHGLDRSGLAGDLGLPAPIRRLLAEAARVLAAPASEHQDPRQRRTRMTEW